MMWHAHLEMNMEANMCTTISTKRTLVVYKALRVWSLGLWEQKSSCKLQRKKMHFLCMFFPTQVLETQHKIFSLYEDYKDAFEKKKIDILLEHWPYDYIIDLEKGAQPYLGPFISCHNVNSRPFKNTLMKNWKKVSFNI